MTAVDTAPANRNFLSPLNFKFRIKKAPGVNFFVQKLNIPSLSLQPVSIGNPFVAIPRAGDHIAYGDFSVTFKVDEDLQNYMEIFNWVTELGKPYNYEQYASIQARPVPSGEGIFSDIEIDILTSKRAANYAVVMEDAFPFDLSGIEFDTTFQDVEYVSATAMFKYKLFTIQQIS